MRLTALAAVVFAVPALASAQPFTFVSTPASDSLVLIDLSSNTVVSPVPLSGLPTGLAVGRAGRRVFAALGEADALAIIRLGTGVVRTVPVGAGPTGVAVDGRRVYVANTGDGTVSVVDAGRAEVVATIPVGDSPFALVAGAQRLYVANWGGGTVSVVDGTTNGVVATLPVGTFPAGLALHTGTRRLFVANFLDDTVSVIDTETLTVVSTIPVARRPRGLAVDAAGGRLFVAGFEEGRVQAIDTGTGAVTLEASSGGLNPLDLMLGPRGARLYVAHLQETQGVAVLDALTLAPVASVDVPAGPVAFSGLARGRLRVPITSRWRQAARAVSDGLRDFAALTRTRRPDRSQSLGGEVVISDGEFDPGHWALSGGGEHNTTQQSTGGNPGAWRSTTHFGPAVSVHRLIRPGSTYHPASQGPIQNIDASWDRRIFHETLVSERFLVEQDNVVYRTAAHTYFAPAWETDGFLELVADDFDDGSGGRPDFGATGGPLRFGYSRHTAFSQMVTHGMDNFTITVRQSDAHTNTLGFEKTLDVMAERDTPFVRVQRRNGVQGAISVDVRAELPDGTVSQETLSWLDGDRFDRSILLLGLDLPAGAGARTAHLTLLNPTGGASIHPARAEMVITVVPEEWPAVITALYLRLQGLFGAFSFTWLLFLALPAAVVAAGRWLSPRPEA